VKETIPKSGQFSHWTSKLYASSRLKGLEHLEEDKSKSFSSARKKFAKHIGEKMTRVLLPLRPNQIPCEYPDAKIRVKNFPQKDN
jgi:hypothetical protein